MKKLMLGVVALSFLATGAHASKARLQALGQDADGSLFVDDHRNIFFNPATINYHRDLITLEAGAASSSDSAATPSSEGGFIKSRGNMVYGLHFGNQNETIKAVRTAGKATVFDNVEGNILDFFVGGDAGVLWGVDLSYGTYMDEQATNEIEASFMRSKVGVIKGNVEAFLDFSLQDTAEEKDNAEVAIKSAYDLMVAYNLRSDAKAYIRYMAINAEEKEIDAKDEDYKAGMMAIGYGRVRSLNNKANLNYNIAYVTTSKENETFTKAKETKSMSVPLVIGLEYKAKDWLTVRGSVSQKILSEEESLSGTKVKKKTSANSTAVNAGVSLHFGDLQIDGLVGNNTGGAAASTDTSRGNGTLRTDNLMSRVSATYKF